MSKPSGPKADWFAHFNMSASPFAKDIADADLWVPSSKKDHVDRMVQAVRAREHVVLTGEPGLGKTCLLRALRKRLPDKRYRLTYMHNASLGQRDFYRLLCTGLGLAPAATPASLFNSVRRHIEELENDRIHPIFIIDEAQLLKDDVLGHLHVLGNFDWDRKQMLSMVLVGLPELRHRLDSPKHRSLYSRLDCRIHLAHPTAEDTTEYVRYRLSRVGGAEHLLASDTLTLLHDAAQGQLRDVGRLATAALQLAVRKKVSIVDRAVFEDVLGRDEAMP